VDASGDEFEGGELDGKVAGSLLTEKILGEGPVLVPELPGLNIARSPSLLAALTSGAGCSSTSSVVGHHVERMINSDGWQCRLRRSQLLQTGFLSSQLAWRDLHV